MATILKQPPALCFSSMIDELVFMTMSNAAKLKVEVCTDYKNFVVLEEKYIPRTDHTIRLANLSELVEVYARQHLEVRLTCSLTDSVGTISITPVTVLYSMADVDTSAEWFTENHFLTVLDGEKVTAMGREERLYAYGARQVTVLADVRLVTGEYNTLQVEIGASGTTGGVSQFDVSAGRIAALLQLSGSLLAYTVESGGRRQRFVLMEDVVPPVPSLIFVNSFGCQEFLHCTGTHSRTNRFTRTKGIYQGFMTRNTLIKEERIFKANTGWLNRGMADWADDLFRSTEVYLWVNGLLGREVIIMDSKSELSNEDDDMPCYEFAYMYSQKNHNVMQPRHAGRVFDNTFDHTFN